MRILKEGAKSKAICSNSGDIEPITYFYRDFQLKNGVKISNVLQGVCDTCGKAITVPAQSTPKIQQYLQDKDISLEVRVPPILEDVLYHISYKSHVETSTALKCIIQFYSNKIKRENNKSIINYIAGIKNNHPLWEGTKRSRISMKISKSIDEKITEIIIQASINKTEYITGLLVKAKEDLIEKVNSKEAKTFYESIELLQE